MFFLSQHLPNTLLFYSNACCSYRARTIPRHILPCNWFAFISMLYINLHSTIKACMWLMQNRFHVAIAFFYIPVQILHGFCRCNRDMVTWFLRHLRAFKCREWLNRIFNMHFDFNDIQKFRDIDHFRTMKWMWYAVSIK